jgi:hypothetical protein
MNREEFFAKLAPHDAEQLRKVLWNLYWRAPAPLRERIEGELDPPERDRRRRKAAEPADPGMLLNEVTEFVSLARDGAYMAGDRRVSPTERSKWRVTFRRLATDAHSALHAADTGPGEAAMEQLIELACDAVDGGYFHSEDPLEAARFVVSHAVSALWQTILDQHGFDQFARRAAAQLIRWESRYGWTRGDGKVSEHEGSLAQILESMLATPDMWVAFADTYLAVLDDVALADRAAKQRVWVAAPGYDHIAFIRKERASELAEWHDMLVDRLTEAGAGDRLDRLVSHPAFAGPEITFLRACLAERRGAPATARTLIRECLEERPGSGEFLAFAKQIRAELPPKAKAVAAQRSRWLGPPG